MTINNESIQFDTIKNNSLFICSLGFEERSFYLLEKFFDVLDSSKCLAFVFKDLLSTTEKRNRVEQEALKNTKMLEIKHSECDLFMKTIEEFISQNLVNTEGIDIYIDYSYMPRIWYCKLPSFLKKITKSSDKIHYVYAEGEYPENYKEINSAGINSYMPLFGKPSLRENNKRTHIIGLSFDHIRTEGILSILDPESFATCDAFDSASEKIHNKVVELNKYIMNRAELSVSFHIEDFSFMVAKISELANEFYELGDVIIIPDGPKPLIFAMSLAAESIEKPGIICLNIKRNFELDRPYEVLPNERIISFVISN